MIAKTRRSSSPGPSESLLRHSRIRLYRRQKPDLSRDTLATLFASVGQYQIETPKKMRDHNF